MADLRHPVPKTKCARGKGDRTRGLSGFTLGETMVGASIAVVILAGLLTVLVMSVLAWQEGSADLNLQSSGRLIIEKIIRGPGGRFGLRESAEGAITIDQEGKRITFLVDKNNPPTYTRSDDTQSRVYFQANQIMYDPSTAAVGDESPIVSFGRVEDVRFQLSGKVVLVDLWMTETSGKAHPSHVRFQTKAFLRKSEDPDSET